MSSVTLENVYKSYGAVRVIHGVDLKIREGEFVAFVGPSGCGKSTLLKVIAGLEEIADGRIRVGGEDVTDEEPWARGVAMVFQSYALYPHMTVRENMSFGLRMLKRPKSEIASKVDAASGTLQLSDLLDRKPRALSGGQRQRVAIGRSTVRDPAVFLFDEPLSNLDAELRVKMRVEIARLHDRLGATMIYVTHDQIEAMTLADRIVVLDGGRVAQVGRPLDLYDDPDTAFVAGFIGSPKMNLMAGTVVGRDGPRLRVTIDASGHEIAADATASRPAAGTPVTVGIRPEHFEVGAEGADAMRVVSDVVEQLGDVTYIYAAPDGGEPLLFSRRNERHFRRGEALWLRNDPARTYLFDAQGGRLR